MKKLLFVTLVILFPIMAIAQNQIVLSSGGKSMTATLVDNQATRALLSILEEGPVTVDMNDYGGFEKVGALPQSLPTSNAQITTVPGDIMLYQGDNIVIFYGSNSWSYTRLGKIDGANEDNLRQFLGNGSISLTISVIPNSSVGEITSDDSPTEETVYDISGRLAPHRPLSPGFYLAKGKKFLIRK